jgi:cysteine desulfurase
MLNTPIYLDNQASTPVDPRVIKAMMTSYERDFANPHAAEHTLGWQADALIATATTQVATLIKADPDEIFFTSGATEANNLAILGAAGKSTYRKRIIVSSLEHKSVIEAANAASRHDCKIETINVFKNGMIDINKLESVIDEDVLLISVIAVNNEVGTIQALGDIGRIAAKAGCLFHTDASQAPAAMDLDVASINCDLLSLSSHKIYGPKGIGALFIRRDRQRDIEPQIYGGGQQAGIRAGTVPTSLCVGFGLAAELISQEASNGERQRIAAMRDQLELQLLELGSFVKTNAFGACRHPGNLNIRFEGHDGRDMLSSLQPDVAASTGSACSSGIPEPSYVLRAIGLSSDEANASIRFGIGRFNTPAEIEKVGDLIKLELDG